MRKPLETTRLRVARAALFGIAAPPMLFEAAMLAQEMVDARTPFISPSFNTIQFFVVIGVGFSAVLFGLFGTPLWWWLHRRGARWPQAAICGAALGLIVPAAVLIATPWGGAQPDIFEQLKKAWSVLALGMVIGAVTAAGIWRIAYRRPARPAALAAAFE